MKYERRHTRYSLDLLDITGKMSMSNKVEILDMSLGGVSLQADRRLDLGREYMINLRDNGKALSVAGVVVRSELWGMEKRANGESASLYRAGIRFKDGALDTVAALLKSTVHNKKEAAAPVWGDRRLTIRFQITTPQEKILSYPVHFKVKTISLGGMLIEAEQDLSVESRIPMVLSLNDGTPVNFIGRVVSCQVLRDRGQPVYEIGSEFIDLTDKDKAALKRFIDDWGFFLTSSDKQPIVHV